MACRWNYIPMRQEAATAFLAGLKLLAMNVIGSSEVNHSWKKISFLKLTVLIGLLF
jgi:hypothetical protein